MISLAGCFGNANSARSNSICHIGGEVVESPDTGLDHVTDHTFFLPTRAYRTGRNVAAHPDRIFLPGRIAALEQCHDSAAAKSTAL